MPDQPADNQNITQNPIPAVEEVPVGAPAAGGFPTATDTGDIQPPIPQDTSTSGAGGSSASPTVVTPGKRKSRGKIIATILGLLLLVGGVGAGVVLVQQQQELREKAVDNCWGCGYHNDGTNFDNCGPGVSCNNVGPNQYCPGGVFVCQANPPATPTPPTPTNPPGPVCGNGTCESGESYSNCQADCGTGPSGGCTVTGGGLLNTCIVVGDDCATNNQLPQGVTYQGGGFNTAAAAGDCVVNDDTPGVSVISSGPVGPGTYCPHNANTVAQYGCGSCMQMDIGGHGATAWSGPCTTGPTPSPGTNQCVNIKAYDANWNQIANLNTLSQGDTVRFAVAGNAISGNFDRARFTINGVLRPEVSNTVPSTTPPEFYDEYVIPLGVTSFTIGAEIHHQQTNTWY